MSGRRDRIDRGQCIRGYKMKVSEEKPKEAEERSFEVEEKPKKRRLEIVERHYLVVNLIMMVLLGIFLLDYGLIQKKINKETAVIVENGTGETCYIALLSTDTDRYGIYTGINLFGRKYEDSLFDRDAEQYWEVVKATGIARGLTEEDAESLVASKKQELALQDGLYAFEVYRELVKVYVKNDGKIWLSETIKPDDYAPYEVWCGLAAFEDNEGYRFVHQNVWEARQGETAARWDELLLPGKFKVLLYWPQSGRYAVSGVLEDKQNFTEFRMSVTAIPESVQLIPAEDVSRSEVVPLWWFAVALAVIVGMELAIAAGLGATKRQLKIIAVVSAIMHVLLFVLVSLTQIVCLFDGSLYVNVFICLLLKFVAIPVVEMPLYVWLLRKKGCHDPGYKYCDFTLFLNWVLIFLYVAVYETATMLK